MWDHRENDRSNEREREETETLEFLLSRPKDAPRCRRGKQLLRHYIFGFSVFLPVISKVTWGSHFPQIKPPCRSKILNVEQVYTPALGFPLVFSPFPFTPTEPVEDLSNSFDLAANNLQIPRRNGRVEMELERKGSKTEVENVSTLLWSPFCVH